MYENLTIRFLPLSAFQILDDEGLLMFLRGLARYRSLSRLSRELGISKSTALYRARKLQRLGLIDGEYSLLANLYLPFVREGDGIRLLRRPLLLHVDSEVYAVRHTCTDIHTCSLCPFRGGSSHMVLKLARSFNLDVRGVFTLDLLDSLVGHIMREMGKGFTALLALQG